MMAWHIAKKYALSVTVSSNNIAHITWHIARKYLLDVAMNN
jgi:hypothetical protein